MTATPSIMSNPGQTPAANAQHVETILRQIDVLPTLPAIATRLLALTADTETHANQVIELISADPTLTAKVLSLSQRLGRNHRQDVTTVERAVQMMGFNAIRNAVLSVTVFDLYGPSDDEGEKDSTNSESEPFGTFDLTEFWWHSIGVAIAAQMIASRHRQEPGVDADEAFVCGLLHDIGKVALEQILPKAMQRVVELANLNQGNIAEFERRVMGLDHHTAGKRLTEQWNLPHIIQDCVWLHGQTFDMLPDIDHRKMVGIISLADLIVRRHYVGYSGNHQIREDPKLLAMQMELDPAVVDEVSEKLHIELGKHAAALGLAEKPSVELFMSSIQKANRELGRLNDAWLRKGRSSDRQSKILNAITAFHAEAEPGRSIETVFESVVSSAIRALGPANYSILYEHEAHKHWWLATYNHEGKRARDEMLTPPPNAPTLTQIDAQEPGQIGQMGLLPFVADYLGDDVDVREVRLIPLGCAWGTVAVLMHDIKDLPPWRELASMTTTWGAAIAATQQHAGAKRMSEQLVESNRQLSEAQQRLLQNESLARLGQMTSGAAHEMNNPLAVISGRGQLLAMKLQPGSEEQKAAQVVCDQAHRLSDLITSLHLMAEPPVANRSLTDVRKLLEKTVAQVKTQLSPALTQVPVSLQWKAELPVVPIDAEQVSQAVTELLLNAMQASPQSCVHLSVRVDSAATALVIQVTDDGVGMDEHTLAHALDPFFSYKPAGRRTGLGLSRVQQWAKAHGGTIDLRSTARNGTVASLTLPLD